jgi:hypothetical protein
LPTSRTPHELQIFSFSIGHRFVRDYSLHIKT